MEYREIERIFYRDGYRLAHEHLGERFDATNLSEAIRQLYLSVDELLDAFLGRTAAEGKPAACRKGCAWCCHQAVFAVTHEFLYLRQFVDNHSEGSGQQRFIEMSRAKSDHTMMKYQEEQLTFRFPCPFLLEGACSVYEARPMACRIYLSSSASACRREHEDPGDEHHFPDLYEFPLRAGRMFNQGFVAYLKQSGLHSSELPVEQGYVSMVETGLTIEEWIGERTSSP
jgi:Fe-S-cluster containining protein